jgi:hypothetical protein
MQLERFAESLLRLVVLVSLSYVKFVCSLADYVRPHVHPSATTLSRPFLSGFQQLGTGTRATLPFRNDQTIDFGPHVTLQQVRYADMDPADDARGISRFRNIHGML